MKAVWHTTPGLTSRWSSASSAFPAMQLALWYGQEGEMNKAFEHLERAIESCDPSIVNLAIAPQWHTLRQDPRFTHCLSLLGLSNVTFPIATIAEAQNP